MKEAEAIEQLKEIQQEAKEAESSDALDKLKFRVDEIKKRFDKDKRPVDLFSIPAEKWEVVTVHNYNAHTNSVYYRTIVDSFTIAVSNDESYCLVNITEEVEPYRMCLFGSKFARQLYEHVEMLKVLDDLSESMKSTIKEISKTIKLPKELIS